MKVRPTALERASSYSNKKIELLRDTFSEAIKTNKFAIVTVGSFARREASEQSDLDFFIIVEDNYKLTTAEKKLITDSIRKLNIKMPSTDGAFNETEKTADMLENIGGIDDPTYKLTRRMLFLLEGEWLYNKKMFERLFDKMINRYVSKSITQHQLCRFLLNDMIRYYRTICVDFEFKTVEINKSWGDRNIKLLFSRKLLYFSGLLVIAETTQHFYSHKREILTKYLRLSPVERVNLICGIKCEKVINMYNEFLDNLSTPKIRKLLNETPINRDLQSPEFRKLKNNGHHFSWELSKLLAETYDSSHPIHLAIKF
ncbi:MAG: nucleotidyltransferase domain-containing protein [Candidatus Thiodiazotropha sp.]